MSEQEPWVVVWAVPKESLDTPCWLMVKHIELSLIHISEPTRPY